jgi:hypothetical protein
MDPRQRTHLVNALMQEAHRMMVALEKAMAGDRSEERHPAPHGTQPTQRHSSLEGRMSPKTGARSSRR